MSDHQGEVTFRGGLDLRKIRAKERATVKLDLWELRVVQPLRLTEKDVRRKASYGVLTPGALYLEGHPVQVRAVEAQALLDGWPEHFEVVSRPDEEDEQ